MVMVPGMQGWALDEEATRETLKGLPGVVVWGGGHGPRHRTGVGSPGSRCRPRWSASCAAPGSQWSPSQEASAPPDMKFLTVAVTTLQSTGGLYAYAVDLAVHQTATLPSCAIRRRARSHLGQWGAFHWWRTATCAPSSRL